MHVFLSPDILVKVHLNETHSIEVLYKSTQNFGSLQDVYRGYILTDYRTIGDNRSAVNESRNQTANLTYTFKKPVNLFFIMQG
jgi:hypothetical protein